MKIVIMGGGTFNHVRNHLALAAPAFGTTARTLVEMLKHRNVEVQLTLTKMADHTSKLVTNEDVAEELDRVIADLSVRVLFFNVALADYTGTVDDVASGAHAWRLKTSQGNQYMKLTPAEKLIGRVRKERKDIFVVGFKTTTNATRDYQYAAGLRLLKQNSLNLVLANDVGTRRNMIIVPEESIYSETRDRAMVLERLATMAVSRAGNTFTRSTVVDGPLIDWEAGGVHESLRKVVDFCRAEHAYKPVLGKTAGHFAMKLDDQSMLTSVRKTDFNIDKALVKVTTVDADTVTAQGAKPSVGGQSQRIIFKEHSDVDCIVHFHSPMKEDCLNILPTVQQWPNECGSHQCGQATSRGLHKFDLGDGHSLKAVMLVNHGPNIVFHHSTPAEKVIDFIESNFDLQSKTGGLGALRA